MIDHGYNTNMKDLIGKKIISLEYIDSEYGRSYRNYVGVTCEDGTRVLLAIDQPYRPDPDLKNMQKSKFFTPDEITNKAKSDALQKERREADYREKQRRELERLKRELGDD